MARLSQKLQLCKRSQYLEIQITINKNSQFNKDKTLENYSNKYKNETKIISKK